MATGRMPCWQFCGKVGKTLHNITPPCPSDLIPPAHSGLPPPSSWLDPPLASSPQPFPPIYGTWTHSLSFSKNPKAYIFRLGCRSHLIYNLNLNNSYLCNCFIYCSLLVWRSWVQTKVPCNEKLLLLLSGRGLKSWIFGTTYKLKLEKL